MLKVERVIPITEAEFAVECTEENVGDIQNWLSLGGIPAFRTSDLDYEKTDGAVLWWRSKSPFGIVWLKPGQIVVVLPDRDGTFVRVRVLSKEVLAQEYMQLSEIAITMNQ